MKVHIVTGPKILEISGYEGSKETRIPLAYRISKGHHYPDYGKYSGLGAIIVGLVDKLDAGTSDRPYRKALPFDEVVENWIMPYMENLRCAPVVETFLRHLEEFRELHDWLHF